MDLMTSRRNIIQAAANSGPTLKYWLDGNDAPVNGKWIEKKTGLEFVLINGASYDSENKMYLFEANNKYAMCNSNINTINFALGNHFIITFDLYINYSLSAGSTCFFDIGSVTGAERAIGFNIGLIDINNTGKSYVSNYKMFGNSNNPFEAILDPFQITPRNDYVHIIGSHTVIDGGDGYDRWVSVVNGQSYYFNTQLTKTYYGPTWQSAILNISVGGGVTSGYGPACRIKDIKIYTID